MDKRLEQFSKNAKLYDDITDYITAAAHAVHRELTPEESSFLLQRATASGGRPEEILKAVGTFDVCHRCTSILRKSNDIFKVVRPRIEASVCSCCGSYASLRRVFVDNIGRVARASVKVAEIHPVRQLVRIIKAPDRYQPIVGETAEIISRQMSNRGPLYSLMLADGSVLPIPFKHNDIMALPENSDANGLDTGDLL